MSHVVITRRVSTAVLMLRTVLLAVLLVAWWFLTKHDGKDFELVAFYLVPFAAALLVPAELADLAGGLAVGAAVAGLPFALFYGWFGGVLPDRVSLLAVRSATAALLFIVAVGITAYHSGGESQLRFYSGLMLSIVYVVLLGAASG